MKICWGLTSSFCTLSRVYSVFSHISKDNDIYPVASFNFCTTDTRFGKAEDHLKTVEYISAREIIDSVASAEQIGPVIKPDVMIIAPCTGNTLAKIAAGIFDTPVTLGAKAHLRNNKPLVIALATNDALSLNFKNIADLYQRKNIYFVPMVQDDPVNKPASLVCRFELIPDAIAAALEHRQLLPLFL